MRTICSLIEMRAKPRFWSSLHLKTEVQMNLSSSTDYSNNFRLQAIVIHGFIQYLRFTSHPQPIQKHQLTLHACLSCERKPEYVEENHMDFERTNHKLNRSSLPGDSQNLPPINYSTTVLPTGRPQNALKQARFIDAPWIQRIHCCPNNTISGRLLSIP